eukprot:4598257-Pyramimonas_sp.AAC.1
MPAAALRGLFHGDGPALGRTSFVAIALNGSVRVVAKISLRKSHNIFDGVPGLNRYEPVHSQKK